MRIAPSIKKRAIAVLRLPAGDLAHEADGQVLEEHEHMVLLDQDRQAFFDAMLNPSEPTEKLVAALRRHQTILS